MRRLLAWLRRYHYAFDRGLLVLGVTAAIFAAARAENAHSDAGRAMSAVARQAARASAEALRTHHAICAFRQDLVDRVRGTEEFLQTHPDGIAGASRAEIEVSLANQRLTIRSLRGARCL